MYSVFQHKKGGVSEKDAEQELIEAAEDVEQDSRYKQTIGFRFNESPAEVDIYSGRNPCNSIPQLP